MPGAYEGVQRLFGNQETMLRIASRYRYDQSVLLILAERDQEFQEKFRDDYERVMSCARNTDKRNPMQYARDIAASWLVEDTLVRMCGNQNGFYLTHHGVDAKRRFLSLNDVSGDSDLQLHCGMVTYNLEVVCDYTGYWLKYGKLHMRDDKYLKLTNERANLLCLSIPEPTKPVFMTMPLLEGQGRLVKNHGPYGRYVYELNIAGKQFVPVNHNTFANDLLNSTAGLISDGSFKSRTFSGERQIRYQTQNEQVYVDAQLSC